ncbi:MAG TPA: hypothetical protein VE258_06045, partial [Ktedonobacterales bacterium]|nr:hypothetical protein [Ktedonobacterales bacterium]
MMPVSAPSADGMPDWLRPLQSNSPGSSALRGGAPPAMPAGPYGAPQPSGMFSAGSLVNEDALPEWLREPGMSGALGSGAGAAGNRGMRPDMGQPRPYAPPQAPAGPAFGGGPYSQAQQPAAGGMAPGGGAQALFDESALPDWLKEAAGNDIGQQPTAYHPAQAPSAAYGSGMAQPPMSAAYGYGPHGAPQPPSTQGFPPSPTDQRWPAPAGAFPSIENAGFYSAGGPSGALNAPSLIDPNALPSWLAGGQPQQAPGSGGLNRSGGMSANSLVDEAALPQWLRAVPRAQASPSAAAYANVPAPWTATAAADESVPTWLKQVYVEANVPQSDKLQTPAGYSAGQPMGAVAASSFVDESALPDWLRSAGGGLTSGNGGYQGTAPPATAAEQRMSPTYMPDDAAGGGEYSERAAGSFAASDLIDPAVLPSWVHGQEPPPQPSFSSTSGWTSRQRAVSLPETGATRAPGAGEGYGNGTAGSGMLMDESNLPVWMRGGPDRRAEPDMDTGWNAAGYSDQYPSAAFESGSLDSGDARRRGPPIPSAELPNWLRTGGPARGGFGDGRGEGPARGAYGAGQPRQPEQEWPEEEDGRAAQWNQWDDGQYAEEYGADFDRG